MNSTFFFNTYRDLVHNSLTYISSREKHPCCLYLEKLLKREIRTGIYLRELLKERFYCVIVYLWCWLCVRDLVFWSWRTSTLMTWERLTYSCLLSSLLCLYFCLLLNMQNLHMSPVLQPSLLFPSSPPVSTCRCLSLILT